MVLANTLNNKNTNPANVKNGDPSIHMVKPYDLADSVMSCPVLSCLVLVGFRLVLCCVILSCVVLCRLVLSGLVLCFGVS